MSSATTAVLPVMDVEYGRVDGMPLLARLYRPRTDDPFPGAVAVHGGGWMYGDRTSDAVIAEALARAGIGVMALDFRMAPEFQYPASVVDVHRGVRWLKTHGRSFGFDVGRIGGLGMSSGGQLILLVAMRPFDPRYSGDLPSGDDLRADATLQYVVACWPVSNPVARFDMAREHGRTDLVQAHDAFWSDQAAMAEGDPQLILERGESVVLPPMLVVAGKDDANVPLDMAERLVDAYGRRGGRVELETFASQPHAFITADPESDSARRALRRIIQFIHSST